MTLKDRRDTYTKVKQEMIRALQPNTTHRSGQNQGEPPSQPRGTHCY